MVKTDVRSWVKQDVMERKGYSRVTYSSWEDLGLGDSWVQEHRLPKTGHDPLKPRPMAQDPIEGKQRPGM